MRRLCLAKRQGDDLAGSVRETTLPLLARNGPALRRRANSENPPPPAADVRRTACAPTGFSRIRICAATQLTPRGRARPCASAARSVTGRERSARITDYAAMLFLRVRRRISRRNLVADMFGLCTAKTNRAHAWSSTANPASWWPPKPSAGDQKLGRRYRCNMSQGKVLESRAFVR